MKRYELIVERCECCPNHHWPGGIWLNGALPGYNEKCVREDRWMSRMEAVAFPEWCRLPDVEEKP